MVSGGACHSLQLFTQYTMHVMVGRELINRPVNACFEWSEVESADNCEYTFECIVSAGELGRCNLGTWQRGSTFIKAVQGMQREGWQALQQAYNNIKYCVTSGGRQTVCVCVCAQRCV